jgi:hypothetical protein
MTPPHPAWVFSETRAILFGLGEGPVRPLAPSPQDYSQQPHLPIAMSTRPAKIRKMAAMVPHCCQR